MLLQSCRRFREVCESLRSVPACRGGWLSESAAACSFAVSSTRMLSWACTSLSAGVTLLSERLSAPLFCALSRCRLFIATYGPTPSGASLRQPTFMTKTIRRTKLQLLYVWPRGGGQENVFWYTTQSLRAYDRKMGPKQWDAEKEIFSGRHKKANVDQDGIFRLGVNTKELWFRCAAHLEISFSLHVRLMFNSPLLDMKFIERCCSCRKIKQEYVENCDGPVCEKSTLFMFKNRSWNVVILPRYYVTYFSLLLLLLLLKVKIQWHRSGWVNTPSTRIFLNKCLSHEESRQQKKYKNNNLYTYTYRYINYYYDVYKSDKWAIMS